MEQTATLLVCCPDRKGLVAALAQVLYGHGANILDADQHTDPVAGQFFQRIKLDLSELHKDRTSLETAISEVAARFSMDWRITNGHRRSKTAIFVSKYDHCLYDLLLRQRSGELSTEIPMIISNHPDLDPVAQQFGIPFHHLPITKETKRAQENQALELLLEADIDLIVLARYMQILTDDFLQSYEGDVINIHHSFLPAFMGSKPYQLDASFERTVIGLAAHECGQERMVNVDDLALIALQKIIGENLHVSGEHDQIDVSFPQQL